MTAQKTWEKKTISTPHILAPTLFTSQRRADPAHRCTSLGARAPGSPCSSPTQQQNRLRFVRPVIELMPFRGGDRHPRPSPSSPPAVGEGRRRRRPRLAVGGDRRRSTGSKGGHRQRPRPRDWQRLCHEYMAQALRVAGTRPRPMMEGTRDGLLASVGPSKEPLCLFYSPLPPPACLRLRPAASGPAQLSCRSASKLSLKFGLFLPLFP